MPSPTIAQNEVDKIKQVVGIFLGHVKAPLDEKNNDWGLILKAQSAIEQQNQADLTFCVEPNDKTCPADIPS